VGLGILFARSSSFFRGLLLRSGRCLLFPFARVSLAFHIVVSPFYRGSEPIVSSLTLLIPSAPFGVDQLGLMLPDIPVRLVFFFFLFSFAGRRILFATVAFAGPWSAWWAFSAFSLSEGEPHIPRIFLLFFPIALAPLVAP